MLLFLSGLLLLLTWTEVWVLPGWVICLPAIIELAAWAIIYLLRIIIFVINLIIEWKGV